MEMRLWIRGLFLKQIHLTRQNSEVNILTFQTTFHNQTPRNKTKNPGSLILFQGPIVLNIRPNTIKRRGKPKVKAGEVSNKQIGDGFGLGKR